MRKLSQITFPASMTNSIIHGMNLTNVPMLGKHKVIWLGTGGLGFPPKASMALYALKKSIPYS